jgi:hypothetical protein
MQLLLFFINSTRNIYKDMLKILFLTSIFNIICFRLVSVAGGTTTRNPKKICETPVDYQRNFKLSSILLDRGNINSKKIMINYPPIFNKKEETIWKNFLPENNNYNSTIMDFARFSKLNLPQCFLEAPLVVREKPFPYKYDQSCVFDTIKREAFDGGTAGAAIKEGACSWYVNFADREFLFNPNEHLPPSALPSAASRLQDEIMLLEHPSLISFRQYLSHISVDNKKLIPQTSILINTKINSHPRNNSGKIKPNVPASRSMVGPEAKLVAAPRPPSGASRLMVNIYEPTPYLITNVQRHGRFVFHAPDDITNKSAIKFSTFIINPPTITHIISIGSPRFIMSRQVKGFNLSRLSLNKRRRPSLSPSTVAAERPQINTKYKRIEIINILETSYTSFVAAKYETCRMFKIYQLRKLYLNPELAHDKDIISLDCASLSIKTSIYTRDQGVGIFGGNKILMTLLQLIAAELAKVDEIIFHTTSPFEGFGFNSSNREMYSHIEQAKHIWNDIKKTLRFEQLSVKKIIALVYKYARFWNLV